ncbi:MAG: hypothetical protein AMXMBFR82_32430 [Candidatus Hydrogenedentota bacterium]
MPTDSKQVYCGTCRKRVPYHFVPVDHKRELIRSIITVGLWLPIWIAMSLSKTKHCDTCGNPIIE